MRVEKEFDIETRVIHKSLIGIAKLNLQHPSGIYLTKTFGFHPMPMLPFIFVAGVQPKTKKLDEQPRRCPRCGLHQAYYRRVDHYFSLFFIPVWRVKKGTPFMSCDRCEQNIGANAAADAQAPENVSTCAQCGRAIDPEFQFCPHCGKEIDS